MESVIEREREIVLRPVETRSLQTAGLEQLLGGAIRFTPNSVRIRMPELEIPWEHALESVIRAIEDVQRS